MPRNLTKYVVGMNQSIRETIATITRNLTRCVIVVDKNNTVVGVISEGDIIRSLLDDVSLYTPVGKVVRPSFRYLNDNDLRAGLDLLKSGVTLIPIVGKNFDLIDVITVHDLMDYLTDQLPDD